MTVIVGLLEGKEAYIASDGRFSAGTEILNSAIVDHKVFKFGNLVIGCSGEVRTMQIIRDNLKMSAQEANQTDQAYLSVVFVKAMESLYKEYSIKEDDKIICMLGYNHKIYRVTKNWAIIEPKYDAVGSGAQVARGALVASFMLKVKLSPEKRLRLAVKAAAQCDNGCGNSFYMVKV